MSAFLPSFLTARSNVYRSLYVTARYRPPIHTKTTVGFNKTAFKDACNNVTTKTVTIKTNNSLYSSIHAIN